MAGAPELDQAQVSQHLELLSYFRSHISIVLVNVLQVGLKFIQLLKREARFC